MTNSEESAFPVSASQNDNFPDVIQVHEYGLTKREYAAIKCLQGLLANNSGNANEENVAEHYAKSAIKFADELFTQLSSSKPESK